MVHAEYLPTNSADEPYFLEFNEVKSGQYKAYVRRDSELFLSFYAGTI